MLSQRSLNLLERFGLILLLLFLITACETAPNKGDHLSKAEIQKQLTEYYFELPKKPIKLNLKPIELLSGVRYNNEELQNNLLLLNFWATWCTPCVHEMPAMETFRRETTGDDIKLFAINFNQSRQEIKKFLRLHPEWKFDIAVDPGNQLGSTFNVQGLPTTILIGRSGNVLGRVVGPIRWDKPEFIRFMKQLSVNNGV